MTQAVYLRKRYALNIQINRLHCLNPSSSRYAIWCEIKADIFLYPKQHYSISFHYFLCFSLFKVLPPVRTRVCTVCWIHIHLLFHMSDKNTFSDVKNTITGFPFCCLFILFSSSVKRFSLLFGKCNVISLQNTVRTFLYLSYILKAWSYFYGWLSFVF